MEEREQEMIEGERTSTDPDEPVHETLEHRLGRVEEAPLSFEDKRVILLELCDALDRIHSEGRAYGKLCPEKIILTYPGRTVSLAEDSDKKNKGDDTEEEVKTGDAITEVLVGRFAPDRQGDKSVQGDIFLMGKLIYLLLPESDKAMSIAERATGSTGAGRFKSVKELKEQLLYLWDPALGIVERSRKQVGMAARSKKLWIRIGIGAAAVLLIVGGGIFFRKTIYPEFFVRRPAYSDGVEAMEDGRYEEAIRSFQECGEDYKDVRSRIRACELEQYREDTENQAKEKVDLWKRSGNNADLENAVKACYSVYENGLDDGGKLQEFGLLVLEDVVKRLDQGDYDKAQSTVRIFTSALPDKKDNLLRTLWEDFYKTLAMGLEEAGRYLDAAGAYRELENKGFSGYTERLNTCKLAYAEEYMKEGRLKDAAGIFQELAKDGVEGAAEKAKEAAYLYGKEFLEKKDIQNALIWLDTAGDYKDAAELAKNEREAIRKAEAKAREEQRRKEAAQNQRSTETDVQVSSSQNWSLRFQVEAKDAHTVDFNIFFRGGPPEGTPGFTCVVRTIDGMDSSGYYDVRVKDGRKETVTLQDPEAEDLLADVVALWVLDADGDLMGAWTQ